MRYFCINIKDEGPALPTIVENMARRYVEEDDMLNLVVIPAENLSTLPSLGLGAN